MIKILCDFCLCLAVTNTPCHKCEFKVNKEAMWKVVNSMKDEQEFLALTCYPEGTEPKINYHEKFGFGPSKK